jgi:hypothetical protein
MVVLLAGVLLHMLVLVSDRPFLPVFMGTGLQLVVLQVMLLLLFLLLLLWELRLPGMTRAQLLVLVLVLGGMDMRLVVGPLMVLLRLLVLARARLLLHEPLGIELLLVIALLVVLLQVLVGDWPLLSWLVGKGLTW